MKILVTGGAGFIGSSVIRNILSKKEHTILNIDALTYAANEKTVLSFTDSSQYSFAEVDITNRSNLEEAIFDFKPNKIMHLAAESHVDRSINDPLIFIKTNILGTFNLLEIAREYLKNSQDNLCDFIFHHISTDEVFGDLKDMKSLFSEETPYAPSSPYSASKASSDHLVRAWFRTYKLPAIITNCSNNYGPYQFPEKLIPLMIINALQGKKLPIYGDGSQIRDWLYVDDHAEALYQVLMHGAPGSTYNIGGNAEKKNLDVVKTICSILDEEALIKPHGISSFAELITFIDDRPGHDARYAIDASKIKTELGWQPTESFNTGIRKTIKWYLDNQEWWEELI